MARLVVELTNRCNLSCQHCFTGRHGGRDDLPLRILIKVLDQAQTHGFDRLSFTGGDPTVHRQFPEVLRLTWEAGYKFGFVTNGWNFTTTYPHILPHRERLESIVFSLDGAREATHDRLRGKGSFRRVMQAVSICVIEDLPFAFNMVISAHNRQELGDMVRLATQLGSRAVRFAHLMPNRITTLQNFDLTPEDRKAAEAEIRSLHGEYPITVGMAPGHHTTSLFPCAPLQMQEANVDCHGNLTKCCALSSHGDGAGQGDVVGNLKDISFAEAYNRLIQENQQFHQAKKEHLAGGNFRDSDFFACWYCSQYYRKVDWLKTIAGHPWSGLMWEPSATVLSAPLTPVRVSSPSLHKEG